MKNHKSDQQLLQDPKLDDVSIPLRGIGYEKPNCFLKIVKRNMGVSIPLRGIGYEKHYSGYCSKSSHSVSIPLRGIGYEKQGVQLFNNTGS
jgi:hypothetical protein